MSKYNKTLYDKYVATYKENGKLEPRKDRADPLKKLHVDFPNKARVDDLIELDEWIASQDESQFQTDLSALLLVAAEIHRLKQIQDAPFWKMLNLKVPSFQDKDLGVYSMIEYLKYYLDEYTFTKFGSIGILYGFTDSKDVDVICSVKLSAEIRTFAAISKKKATKQDIIDAFRGPAETIHLRLTKRLITVLKSLSPFMLDTTKINIYISKLTGDVPSFYTTAKTSAAEKSAKTNKPGYEDRDHFVYAWQSNTVVKIGRTASYYEAFVFSSTDFSAPKKFDDIRDALPMGISSSRIYQVARRLTASLEDVLVLGVFGPYDTRESARKIENTLRTKYTSITKDDILTLYFDPGKHDGYTEFVEYENTMSFSQLSKDIDALSDSVRKMTVKK